MDKLRAKLPRYKGRRIYFLLMYTISVFIIGLTYLIFLDYLSLILFDNIIIEILESSLPILGTLTLIILGLGLVRIVWMKKELF